MTALAVATNFLNIPIPPAEDFVFSAGEIEIAAELTAHGIWYVWRRNRDGFQPIWRGTTDTRAKAEAECKSRDDYICLMAHNLIHDGETTNDPTPYLCYPRDPQYRIQNTRDAELFGALEREGKARLKMPVTQLLHETVKWMTEVRQAAGLHP